MNKSGFIYSNMRKFRMKYAIIVILYTIAVIVFALDTSKYILKRIQGPTALNTIEFAKTETIVLPHDYFIDKTSDDARIWGSAAPGESYWQGNKYYFNVTADEVIETNVAYTVGGFPVTDETDTDADPVTVKAYYAIIDGITVPVLTEGDVTINSGNTLTGIFTRHSPLILEQLAKNSNGADIEISRYTLDTRGIDMGSEFSDCVLLIMSLVLVLYLIIKLVIYFVNPIKHPIYTQLDKYGESQYVAEDIDREIKNEKTTVEGASIYTPNWILTKKSFKYEIVKNHAAGGKFKYTP